MNNLRLGIAAASLVISASAFAQAPAPSPGATTSASGNIQFSNIDKNGDGRVSRAEAQSYSELTSSFNGLDSDSDTYLSQLEFGKWKSTPPPAGAIPAPTPGTITVPPPGSIPQPGQTVPPTAVPLPGTAPLTPQ